ncbi:MAG TPA: ATP-binding protein, partial [Ignavibacteriaceae bacterium]|nr:ATP-binding protein [Ignavibacteriaceae bacterium]
RRIRPLSLDELGLNTVLVSLCKTVAKESHLNYQLNLPADNIKLSKDLELCIYRVVQEALNNIIKHSKASGFSINLNLSDGSVTLGISDDGIGFKPSILLNDKYISDGLGIMNMQERIERLNGKLHIDSSINKGTIIFVYFPLTEEVYAK